MLVPTLIIRGIQISFENTKAHYENIISSNLTISVKWYRNYNDHSQWKFYLNYVY